MKQRVTEPNFELLHEWLQEFNETDGTLCPLEHAEIVWIVNARAELAEMKQAVRDLRAALEWCLGHGASPNWMEAASAERLNDINRIAAATAHLVAEEGP